MGLSIDNADAGIPYNGAPDLGNLEYEYSGVVIDNIGAGVDSNTSVSKIIRLANGDNKLNMSSDLENHISDDLDNHWEELMGCSHPPSQTPMHHNMIINDYRFIPLEKNEIYQGPESRAAVNNLWGSRELSDYDLHNFNSYRVPVPSGFKIEKFKKLASGYWDEQLFELLKYGFPLDVRPDFMPSNKQYNHSSADKYPEHVRKYIDKETATGALKELDGNKF
jgi:hypothetical protein